MESSDVDMSQRCGNVIARIQMTDITKNELAQQTIIILERHERLSL